MTDTATVVFIITLGVGQYLWKVSAINCLMQNKRVELVLSGSQAAAVGNALKVPLPKVTVENVKMTATMVLVIAILTIIYVQPLVDVLNVAFGRNYTVRVRHKKKGAGVHDDEFILELIP